LHAAAVEPNAECASAPTRQHTPCHPARASIEADLKLDHYRRCGYSTGGGSGTVQSNGPPCEMRAV
jgi:hypothetical protein